MTRLWDIITQWPAIIQGALGSALFWAVLELLRRVISEIQQGVQSQTTRAKTETLLREYIYRKYTSHGGLAYYPQGYFFMFSRVFRFFMVGMLFFAIALLAGGVTQLFLTIGLIGAIYYFSQALLWLIPASGWHSLPTLQHWQRIGELEQVLFGETSADTKEFMAKWHHTTQDNNPSNQTLHMPSEPAPGAASSAREG